MLKPGGRLMMADFLLPDERVPAESEAAMRTWTRGWAIPNLTSVPAFTSELAAHGFQERPISRHPAARAAVGAATLQGKPRRVAGGRDSAGARRAVTAAARERPRCLPAVSRPSAAGAWTYGIFVAVK